VTLDVPALTDELVAWLAHELQHALEIASDCTVVSERSMAEFYRRHGVHLGDGSYCTRAARLVASDVAYELATTRIAKHR
jgi:hypothetical protein